MRQRNVWPTEEIPHKWIHATQESARNPQGNLSFEGDTIRSYRTDVARIYRKRLRTALGAPITEREEKTLVLVSERNYSNTTARQLHLIRMAASHLPCIRVPQPVIGAGMHTAKQDHEINLAYLTGQVAECLKKAQRATTRRNAEWRSEAAGGFHKQAEQYAGFFSIRRKIPAFPAAEFAAALQRAERIENPDPIRAAKRFKNREKRDAMNADVAEYRAEMARSLQAAGHYLGYRAQCGKHWPATLARLGLTAASIDKRAEFYKAGCHRSAWRLGFPNASGRIGPVMLRLNGEQIETSQGARIPAAAAPMVWNLVNRAVAEGGRDFHGGLKRIQIGDYPLDRVEADGTLVAGCHRIPHSELRSMARQMGLS